METVNYGPIPLRVDHAIDQVGLYVGWPDEERLKKSMGEGAFLEAALPVLTRAGEILVQGGAYKIVDNGPVDSKRTYIGFMNADGTPIAREDSALAEQQGKQALELAVGEAPVIKNNAQAFVPSNRPAERG